MDYLCWLGGHFTDAEGRRARLTAAMNAVVLHERALMYRMLCVTGAVAGLRTMPNVTVHGDTGALDAREPCLVFSRDGLTSEEVVSALGKRGVRVNNRVPNAYSRHTLEALGISECVRVSMAHYNSPAEVDLFLNALAELP